jgi:hypothetical protein
MNKGDSQMVGKQSMKSDADDAGEEGGMQGQSCPRCGGGMGGGGMGGGGMSGGGMGGGGMSKESNSGMKAEAPRSALDILDERFARSEIEKEEYIEKKTLISQRPKPE